MREVPKDLLKVYGYFIQGVRQHYGLIAADDYELVVQDCTTTSETLVNERSPSHIKSHQSWISLRVWLRKRLGRAVTTSFEVPDMENLVERAIEVSQCSSADPWFRFPIWKKPRKKEVLPIPNFPAFARQKGNVRTLREMETVQINTLLLRKSEREILTDNNISHRIRFSAMPGNSTDDRPIQQQRVLSNTLSPMAIQAWMDRLCECAVAFHDDVGAAPPQLPKALILGPAVAAGLLNEFGEWFCADNYFKKISPVYLKQEPFSKELTLLDSSSGDLDNSPFDLEGAAIQETVVLKEGRLESLLFDSPTAARENRLSTGNLLRQLHESFPRIQPRSLVISPGSQTRADLMEQLRPGVVLEYVDRIWKVHNKKWGIEGRGWYFPDKTSPEPLKTCLFFFDPQDLLRKITAIGNDFSFFVSTGAPSILVEGLKTD